jgi:alkane 1-monooxygenase
MLRLFELKYLFAYTAIGSAYLALYLGGWWSYVTILYAFILIPLFEVVLEPISANLSAEEEEQARENPFFDYLLWLNVPLQWGLFVLFLYRVSAPGVPLYELVGYTLSAGLTFGVGINIAHELGHRHTWHERLMSRLMLWHSLYMHFLNQHNNWHHRWVATPKDPATSFYNQSLYAFWVKTIVGTWRTAWLLERERLERAGLAFWSFRNEMLWISALHILLVVTVFGLFGTTAGICFLFAALGGVLLLETVNYIEHYGLQRKELKPGIYEPVKPHHSWNSDHVLGRILLYELTRHSDHHFKASRPYQVLRHFDQSPQLITGYPGSMLMALVPPLWFSVMNPRVEAFNRNLGSGMSTPHTQTALATA